MLLHQLQEETTDDGRGRPTRVVARVAEKVGERFGRRLGECFRQGLGKEHGHGRLARAWISVEPENIGRGRHGLWRVAEPGGQFGSSKDPVAGTFGTTASLALQRLHVLVRISEEEVLEAFCRVGLLGQEVCSWLAGEEKQKKKKKYMMKVGLTGAVGDNGSRYKARVSSNDVPK